MKKITMTDPFTGIDFEAMEFADGAIVAINPLTGEEIRMNWNGSCNRYMLPKSAFRKIESVSYSEAAKISGTKRQTISKACATGAMQAHELPNGDKRILLEELERYNQTKKAGRPRKDC